MSSVAILLTTYLLNPFFCCHRNIIFIGGGPLAILMLLAIYDEDVVQVEHVLMLMSILGAMVVIAR